MIKMIKGTNVKGLIAELEKLPKLLPVLIASDEEQNQVFKGFFLETYNDGVIIAGLSGCELED